MRNLEVEHSGVNTRSFADFVNALEANAKEPNLFRALRCLSDGKYSDDVAEREGDPIVANGHCVRTDRGLPMTGLRVVGILEKFKKEMSRIGINAAGE